MSEKGPLHMWQSLKTGPPKRALLKPFSILSESVEWPDVQCHFRNRSSKLWNTESPQKQQFQGKKALQKISGNAFKFLVVSNYSYMDRNNHMNQSSYNKFCMDPALHASVSGHYVLFIDDVFLYAPLLWTISYVGKRKANSELSIYTWQDEALSVENIQFLILINDRLIVYASTIFEKQAKEIVFPFSNLLVINTVSKSLPFKTL